MIKNYSASSLKLLDKDKIEYDKRYKLSLFFRRENEFEKEGNIFHKLIFYYLKGFDISKMVSNLDNDKKIKWEKFIESRILKENCLYAEKPFLTKEEAEKVFFLNGRYDAIYKEGETYILYDWKSENIPNNPEFDIQTIVYLYTASKLFNTNNIKLRYVSINKLETKEISFDKSKDYQKIIYDIVKKDD